MRNYAQRRNVINLLHNRPLKEEKGDYDEDKRED